MFHMFALLNFELSYFKRFIFFNMLHLQHYVGEVTMVHLYEGAFVNFGAVHDG